MYRKYKWCCQTCNTRETSSKRCQSFARPLQPKDKILYILLVKGLLLYHVIIAKSGNNPVHQNTSDTERYVEIANTSHNKGELKFTHNEPNWFGIGNTQYASQGRPMCIIGNKPAWITEKIVIASAETVNCHSPFLTEKQ